MEELLHKMLTLTDKIQVRRTKLSYSNLAYEPIIDWYYPDEGEFEGDDLDLIDSCDSIEEYEREKADNDSRREQYIQDKPYLKEISVESVLIEMLMMNSLFQDFDSDVLKV